MRHLSQQAVLHRFTLSLPHRQLASPEESLLPRGQASPPEAEELATQPATTPESDTPASASYQYLPAGPSVFDVKSARSLWEAIQSGNQLIELQEHLNLASDADLSTRALLIELKFGALYVWVRIS